MLVYRLRRDLCVVNAYNCGVACALAEPLSAMSHIYLLLVSIGLLFAGQVRGASVGASVRMRKRKNGGQRMRDRKRQKQRD